MLSRLLFAGGGADWIGAGGGGLGANLQAEARAFGMLVREGLQPLLRVMRYRGSEGEIRETVRGPSQGASSPGKQAPSAEAVCVCWLRR